jgi:undecaprenyl-diphosphatase
VQGLAFDVAVHIGSLAAVVIYFRQTIWDIAKNFLASLIKQPHDASLSLQGWLIILGTVPAVVVGYLAKDLIDELLHKPGSTLPTLVIAITTVLFGLALWWADVKAKQTRTIGQLTWKDALFIGCAQAIALIPGTSRSGITMTAGLMLGMKKVDTARFSFLLSIPLILAAGLLLTLDLIETPSEFDIQALAFGTVLSFISAFACIVLFLKWIERSGFLPFVVYRLVLGLVLFFVYFS